MAKDERVRELLEIITTYCHEDAPSCSDCPFGTCSAPAESCPLFECSPVRSLMKEYNIGQKAWRLDEKGSEIKN